MLSYENLYETPRQPVAAVSISVGEPLGSSPVTLFQQDDDTYESTGYDGECCQSIGLILDQANFG